MPVFLKTFMQYVSLSSGVTSCTVTSCFSFFIILLPLPSYTVLSFGNLPCAHMRSRVKRLVPSVCIYVCVYVYMCM